MRAGKCLSDFAEAGLSPSEAEHAIVGLERAGLVGVRKDGFGGGVFYRTTRAANGLRPSDTPR